MDVGLGCGRKKGKENPLTMADYRQRSGGEEEEICGLLQTMATEEKKRFNFIFERGVGHRFGLWEKAGIGRRHVKTGEVS